MKRARARGAAGIHWGNMATASDYAFEGNTLVPIECPWKGKGVEFIEGITALGFSPHKMEARPDTQQEGLVHEPVAAATSLPDRWRRSSINLCVGRLRRLAA
jgi:hypothetical protein